MVFIETNKITTTIFLNLLKIISSVDCYLRHSHFTSCLTTIDTIAYSYSRAHSPQSPRPTCYYFGSVRPNYFVSLTSSPYALRVPSGGSSPPAHTDNCTFCRQERPMHLHAYFATRISFCRFVRRIVVLAPTPVSPAPSTFFSVIL